MDVSDFPIRLSSPKEEGLFQASKWTKIQVLLDTEEMQALLEELGNVYFAIVSKPVSLTDALYTREQFLFGYKSYIDLLKAGKIPKDSDFRSLFSAVLTDSLDALYAMEVGKEKYLIKLSAPVIQLQAHHFFYSELDHQFHSMVLSPDSITWGLQFSYPQWVQDPKTRKIQKTKDNPTFTNTRLFSHLMKWMRNATLPTPFLVEGQKYRNNLKNREFDKEAPQNFCLERATIAEGQGASENKNSEGKPTPSKPDSSSYFGINAPLRIGRKVLPWIENHAQLKEKKLKIFRP